MRNLRDSLGGLRTLAAKSRAAGVTTSWLATPWLMTP
jgi:hypothetical protein